MKILMLTDRLAFGGAETHIDTLVRVLRRYGHTVEIASAGGPYAMRLYRQGVPLHTLPLCSKDPLSLFRAKHGLRQLLACGEYDLVHAHARLPAALADPLCRHQGIPLITTAHWVFRSDGWRGRMSVWGAHTLAVSPDIAEYLQSNYGLPPGQITHTRNGIDTLHFCPPPRKMPGGRVLHISRLDTGRSATAAALIAIAPTLAAGGCSSLTIVGEGEQLASLKKAAKRANQKIGRNLIRMAGGQSDVLPFLQEADLFVGVSRAAQEAMACGLPVILCGDEGYLSLFDPANAAAAEAGNFCCRGAGQLTERALCDDVLALIQTPEQMQQRGRENAAYIRAHYDAKQMAEDALSVYAKFYPKKRKRPPIMLCGYYGFDNLGDACILNFLLTSLRREGYDRITLLCARPKETTAKFGVPVRSRLSLLALRRLGKEGGVFLLGGGNLLQNETSSRSLLYYSLCAQLAAGYGCRVWILGGLGRLTRLGEKIAGLALSKAEVFLGRTPKDIALCKRLCDRPAHLLPDGALWLKPAALPNGLPDGPSLYLALHGCMKTKDAYALADACALYAGHTGLGVRLVCMHRRQDMALARAVTARIPGSRILPPLSAGALLALMLDRGHLVVSTRLHMLLFAAVAGVRAITVADGGKISAFAAYAAECDTGESTAMLTCLATPDRQSALHILAKLPPHPPSQQQRRRYLNHLRAPGQGFSFSSL